jgi:hypothetical protein
MLLPITYILLFELYCQCNTLKLIYTLTLGINAYVLVHNNLFTHMWLEQFKCKILKENQNWRKPYKQICYGLMV